MLIMYLILYDTRMNLYASASLPNSSMSQEVECSDVEDNVVTEAYVPASGHILARAVNVYEMPMTNISTIKAGTKRVECDQCNCIAKVVKVSKSINYLTYMFDVVFKSRHVY